MLDGFGRKIDYVRVSVTDRCNLRCIYCMPEDGVEKMRHSDILSYEEIVRICRVLAEMGISKIKVTGGEPMVRPDVPALIGALKAVKGVESVTLTTNGTLLAGHVQALRAAGLDGLNISLDTLDAARYREITRCGELADALAGLDAALEAGIPTVKLNCVPMEDSGSEDLLAIASLAQNRSIQVRFIEMMPIGLGAGFATVDNAIVRRLIEEAYGKGERHRGALGNGPATYISLPGFRGKIGFISALNDCFCGRCNRIRLTANGALVNCLHAPAGTSLKPALAGRDDELLKQILIAAITEKPGSHRFRKGNQPLPRSMFQIGG